MPHATKLCFRPFGSNGLRLHLQYRGAAASSASSVKPQSPPPPTPRTRREFPTRRPRRAESPASAAAPLATPAPCPALRRCFALLVGRSGPSLDLPLPAQSDLAIASLEGSSPDPTGIRRICAGTFKLQRSSLDRCAAPGQEHLGLVRLESSCEL